MFPPGDGFVEDSSRLAYVASLGDLRLEIHESNGRYHWSIQNVKTGEEIGRDEAAYLEEAMVGAAQAAGAEWGALKWRNAGAADERA